MVLAVKWFVLLPPWLIFIILSCFDSCFQRNMAWDREEGPSLEPHSSDKENGLGHDWLSGTNGKGRCREAKPVRVRARVKSTEPV